MEDYGELAIDAGMRYSDIIVPTLDTVRSSFLIELLLTNNKRVSVYIDHSNCSLCTLIACIPCGTTFWWIMQFITNPVNFYLPLIFIIVDLLCKAANPPMSLSQSVFM